MRRTRKSTKGQYSIPELRRSFEYIEQYVDNKIQSKETNKNIIKNLRKEWKRVFSKELNKKSAEAFVNDRSKFKRNTLRKGGMAPVDYALRPGVYVAPGQIPIAGHLPTSGLVPSDFGNYTEYVDKGFFNPNIAQSYDPLSYQTRFPTSVPEGMGSNLFKGGRRRSTRSKRTRKGGSMGSLISEAFQRPIPASSPPAILQDMQSMWNGTSTGPSPDQVQRQPVYVR